MKSELQKKYNGLFSAAGKPERVTERKLNRVIFFFFKKNLIWKKKLYLIKKIYINLLAKITIKLF